jgi:hypothetical protein
MQFFQLLVVLTRMSLSVRYIVPNIFPHPSLKVIFLPNIPEYLRANDLNSKFHIPHLKLKSSENHQGLGQKWYRYRSVALHLMFNR